MELLHISHNLSLRLSEAVSTVNVSCFQEPGLFFNVIFISGVVLLMIIFWSAVYTVYFHPLSKWPGPKLWALSRLPLCWHFVKGDVWQAVAGLHQRYGTTIRIAPDELSTIAPDAWRDIYASKPVLPKDPLSQTPPLKGADSLFTAVGDKHRRLRGIFANSFSEKALRDQSPIIEKYVSMLMDRIRREIRFKGGTLDIQRLYGYTSLDIIRDLTSAESAHCLEDFNENDTLQQFSAHARFSTFRNVLVHLPPLDRILMSLVMRLTAKRREENWNRGSKQLNRRLLKDRSSARRLDILDAVVDKVSNDKGPGLSKVELLTNCLGFVLASSQLTTHGLTAATYGLARDRQTLERLSKEIHDARFENEGEITIQSTKCLPYLQATINEAMRIHHPTPITLPRLTPPEGRLVDGEHVPGKCIVGINLQVIQNSANLWSEPRSFHPERFLSLDDPRYDKAFDGDVRSAFQPFSVGTRNCIGAKLFWGQARVVLARMVYSFEFELVDQDDDAWFDQKAFLAFEQRPLWIKVGEKNV